MTTYYTKDHERVRIESDSTLVGITAHAAQELGELFYVELSGLGSAFTQGDEMGVLKR